MEFLSCLLFAHYFYKRAIFLFTKISIGFDINLRDAKELSEKLL